MKQKYVKQVMCMLALAGTLLFSACGQAQDAGAKENSPVQESNTGADEAGVTGDDAGTVVEEKIPVEPDVPFDTVFEVKEGDKFVVGRDGVTIEIKLISTDEYSTFMTYTLTIDGASYEGTGSVLPGAEEGTNWQEEFTLNRVLIKNATETGLNIAVTETTEVKEPLVLSGNAEDEYVITKHSYVESESFIMFLYEGITITGDTAQYFENMMAKMEEITGMKFYNDTFYANTTADDVQYYFGQDVFPGVDPHCKKVQILVVPPEVCETPCASNTGILLHPVDMKFSEGEWAAVHELSHCIHMRNYVSLNRVLTEGYAIDTTEIFDQRYPEFNLDYNPAFNYEGYPVKITAENAEEEFNSEKEDDWSNYLYGYKFVNFIQEQYGEDVVYKIMEDATAIAGQWEMTIEDQRLIDIVKKNTSETVFEDFGNLKDF